jgi:DNA repair exonuclease SbcCD ATPase subunit
VSEKTRVTVSLPRERRDQLDREADRRGASRSSTVHQIISEWDERGEEIEELRAQVNQLREERAELETQLDEREEALADGGEVDDLRAEVTELRAELAEERAADEDDAEWAEQVFGVSAASAAILAVAAALSWVGGELLPVEGAVPFAFGLAMLATSTTVAAAVARAAMRRSSSADPAPDEEGAPA